MTDPPAPYRRRAKPCTACLTHYGKPRTPGGMPRRIKGRCERCDNRIRSAARPKEKRRKKRTWASKCKGCGTKGGYIPPDQIRPRRIKGRCSNCAGTDRYRKKGDEHSANNLKKLAKAIAELKPGKILKDLASNELNAKLERREEIKRLWNGRLSIIKVKPKEQP